LSQAVKEALRATTDLPKNERAVVIAIAAHANDRGDAWPSVATIAEYVGCSERTVQRIIAKLVTLGRLVWRTVAGIPTRVYRLVIGGVTNPGSGVTDPDSGVTDSADGGDSKSANVSPEVPKPNEKKKGWRERFGHDNPLLRRGAALPPPRSAARCKIKHHESQLAHNCLMCNSEALAGGNR
jgi:hypothetical protein